MTFFKAASILARSSSYFVKAALVAAALALAGCGTLPTNTGKDDSVALPLNPESPLVKIAKASSPGEDQTGVRLMPLGAYSLDTRMQLAQRATTSLECSTQASGSVRAACGKASADSMRTALTAGTTSSSAKPPGRPVMPCSV